jgi:hypothetical protein
MTVHSAFAQEKLSVNQPVNQTVTAGVTNKDPIRLNDGDYVEVSLASQSSTVSLLVANPDGSLLRDFAGPSVGARNTYAFAAEGAGIFSLNFVNPGEQAAIYELTLQKIVSLDERFRPGEWSDSDPSPRIQALREQIASGETNTESIWKEIAAQGTPLVEELNANYWLVTFLWRAQHDTRSLMVTGSFKFPDPGGAAELGRRSGESRKASESEPILLLPPKTAGDLHKALGQIFAKGELRAHGFTDRQNARIHCIGAPEDDGIVSP